MVKYNKKINLLEVARAITFDSDYFRGATLSVAQHLSELLSAAEFFGCEITADIPTGGGYRVRVIACPTNYRYEWS